MGLYINSSSAQLKLSWRRDRTLWWADGLSDVLWLHCSFCALMRVISLTDTDRQGSHVESLCHSRLLCHRSQRPRMRERERGGTRDSNGIKERSRGVTMGAKQASNYLPTGALTPWKRSAALQSSRAGLSCHHLACMLSYGQLLVACHYGLMGLKKRWNMIRSPVCYINHWS